MVVLFDALKDVDAWLKLLVGIGGSIAVLYAWVIKPIQKMLKLNKEQNDSIRALAKQVDELKTDIARLQGSQLNQAHDYYIERGWCPGSKKRELEEWYKAYTGRGFNHLAPRYLDHLMSLPEHPPVTKGE